MSVYEFGPFQLDEERLLLLERGEPIPIGPKVVETLLALVEHPGEVYAKSELLERIWPEGYVDEANLAQNVYVLRKTLRKSWNAGAIETIPRRGYRFAAPVFRRDDVPRPQPALVRARVSPWRGLAVAAGIALALLGGSALSSSKVSGSVARSPMIAEDTRLYAIGRVLLESAHARRHRQERRLFLTDRRQRSARRARLRRIGVGQRDHGELRLWHDAGKTLTSLARERTRTRRWHSIPTAARLTRCSVCCGRRR